MTVTIAADAASVAQCLAIRADVFMVEQGVSEAEELDGLDEKATHLLAWSGAVPIGTLRMRRLGTVAKIERVCVLAAHRGQGHAADLTRQALATISGWEVETIALSAQVTVIPFYERFGFVATGPEYMDAGIPHRDMVRGA